jgi:hypothetical protein
MSANLPLEIGHATPFTPRKTLPYKRQVLLMLRDGLTDHHFASCGHPMDLRITGICRTSYA